MAKDTKIFKVSEFTCKCGCGTNNIDQRIINMAQKIRDEVGKPVRVNSGCRVMLLLQVIQTAVFLYQLNYVTQHMLIKFMNIEGELALPKNVLLITKGGNF